MKAKLIKTIINIIMNRARLTPGIFDHLIAIRQKNKNID
jgi:hypothetical protein